MTYKDKVLELIKDKYKTMYGIALRYGKTTYASFIQELLKEINQLPDSLEEKIKRIEAEIEVFKNMRLIERDHYIKGLKKALDILKEKE